MNKYTWHGMLTTVPGKIKYSVFVIVIVVSGKESLLIEISLPN